MICKRCMVVMAPGTTYERKKGGGRYAKITHKRFCQCPKCKEQVYGGSVNFQEILTKAAK